MQTIVQEAELARKLETAWQDRSPIAPFTETGQITSVEQAYAVQSQWSRIRLEDGDRIIGRKIGLTSKAIQKQLGVTEPDYGGLWQSRYFPVEGGVAEMPADLFLQCKIEGEIAFRLGRALAGPEVTPEQVLEATDAMAVAIETIDSRIEDWRIKLIDTVADNASFGAFTHGPWSRDLLKADLPGVRMRIDDGKGRTVEGTGAAVLGHPARAVAWLINTLSAYGVSLDEGDIVFSGSLGQTLAASAGDEFLLEMTGQDPLRLRFT